MTATTAGTPGAGTTGSDDAHLVVEDLTVAFPTPDGVVHAVNGLSYQVKLGRTLGIVGESGSGKSVSSMAIMGLHDRKTARISGSIRLDGKELVGASESEFRRVRGNAAAMIFQDPLSSLHPFFSIGDQIAEAYTAHHNTGKKVAKARALDLLGLVGIPSPRRSLRRLPAPVLRRHAAARDDRDGPGQRPEAADRGRADDGARRHRPGADPRPSRGCSRSSGRPSSSSPTTSVWSPRWRTTCW